MDSHGYVLCQVHGVTCVLDMSGGATALIALQTPDVIVLCQ
jgi:hypothetical protein